MRERAGLPAEGAIGDGAKNTVIGNMLGKSQLDGDRFPQVTYTSSSCTGSGNTFDVTGTLTIHGVSKKLTVPMTIDADGTSFSAKGKVSLGHADFGMKPFTYGPATPKNKEQLVFHIDVVGAP